MAKQRYQRRSPMLVAMILIIAACSGGGLDSSDTTIPTEVGTSTASTAAPESAAPETTAPQTTAEGDGVIDLRMTIWTANDAHLELFNSIAEEYTAEHPEIGSITYDPLPFDEYISIVTTQIAGGNPPDLIWIVETDALDFVGSDALMPLDDVLASTEGYDLDDLAESPTGLWTNEDGLVAYPFSSSPFVVFANDDILAEAGQPSSAELFEQGWDWETVSDVGSAVNEATGKAGFVIRGFDYLNWTTLATVWLGWDARPWTTGSEACEFTSPEMVSAFEFIHSAAFEDQSMPGPGTTADFFAGEAAFSITQISRASLLEGEFSWNLLPLPSGPTGEYSMIGQAGVAVLNQGANPDAAAEFLAFFTNPENSERLAQFFPPPRESQLNAETLAAANPILTDQQIQEVVVPAIVDGVNGPLRSNAVELGQQVRAALDAMWSPEADVAGVLAEVCEAIEPLLADSE